MKKNSLWVKNSTFHSVVPFRILLSVCVCYLWVFQGDVYVCVYEYIIASYGFVYMRILFI